MKILVCSFVYFGEDAGSTHTVEVWRHLVQKAHVKLLLPNISNKQKNELFQKIIKSAVSFIPLTKRTGNGMMNILKFAFSSFLYDICSIFYAIRWKPDCIYIRIRFLSFAPIFFKLFGFTYYSEINGLAQYGATKIKRNFLINLFMNFHITLERHSLRHSKRIVCVTAKLVEIINKEYKIPINQCIVIPNGVDMDHFKPITHAKEKLGFKEDTTILGFVGHFAPWQGLQNLIPALNDFFFQNRIYKLVLVGDGIMRGEWETICEKCLPPGSFLFTGLVNYALVPLYINAFDICVAPFTQARNSEIGLSPLKLYEYMSCAKPVLVTNISGVSDIVEKTQSGVIIESDESNSYHTAIDAIMNKKESWKDMGERGRALVKKDFSWQKNAEQVRELLGF